MKKQSLNQLIHLVNRHDVKLIGSAGIGIVTLAVVLFLFVIPQAVRTGLAQIDLDSALQQKAAVEKRPIPIKMTAEEVQKAVEQVPTKDESARLLMTLRELEKQTKVKINSITFGEGSQKLTQEQLIFGAMASPQPTAAPSAAPAPAASPANGSTAGTAVFQEEKITLSLSGTYSQVNEYMDKLHQQTRIISIKDWSLIPVIHTQTKGGTTNPADSTYTPSTGELEVQASINLGVYTAAQYSGKFNALPPLTVEPGANRKDPLWNDDMMVELAKPAQP
jgi:hypothetical protein